MSSFIGAIAIADLVKTTLGPKGMDKILQSVSRPQLAPSDPGKAGASRERMLHAVASALSPASPATAQP